MSLYSDNFAQRDAELVAPPEISRWSLKRVFDIVFSLLAALFLLPALVVIAIALLLIDGRPIIFRHKRIGRGGRSFSCLKFRSMRKDADKVLAELLETDAERRQEWENSQKLKNDPRIHWLGKLLRITSFDELPQLFNILAGDMSIVGPRPIVADELDRYGPNLNCYLAMTPGLTGLWQVSRRPDTSYEERIQFDVEYYKSCSMRTDLSIIMKTIIVVLFARNDR
ncbi:MAG: sugar transferase [Alphaproteobacteria bacterium]|uniref:Sugar transferase n=1 Tax=Peteryoungia algae TaxID=2919917 RepID=A0ABT0D565_9HYPH|nr:MULTISPECIES: sugar transferase [unclassified Rhizobium]MBU2326284.1 sugar transferase [Alphaproteobacteria bacterium]MCC8934047.1 sugar transferase [Rhizobium sp. 'Codium 1']MCJ8240543.1 sugar transferase [Rhizobium sp. SSM4.3]